MKTSRFFPGASCLALALCAALVAGCGRGDRKPVYPAHGQVLLNGRPTPNALVILHPVGGDRKAPRPQGKVEKDGRFALTTYDAGDGAPPGDYEVTVEWWLTNATVRTPEGDTPPPTNRLPARYARAQTSRLRVHIGEGENELPPFRLTR